MIEPIDKHAQRRLHSIERLQEAALKVLARKNYSAIRVEDITEQAGMAKGSLYMYFKSKEELYIKTINKYFLEQFNRLLDSLLKRRDSKDALRELVYSTFEIGSTNQNIEIFYRAVMDKPLLELIHPQLEKLLDSYLDVVKWHFSAIGVKNPSQRALSMFALLDGLHLYRFLKLAGNWHWESARAMERLKSEVLRLLDLE